MGPTCLGAFDDQLSLKVRDGGQQFERETICATGQIHVTQLKNDQLYPGRPVICARLSHRAVAKYGDFRMALTAYPPRPQDETLTSWIAASRSVGN